MGSVFHPHWKLEGSRTAAAMSPDDDVRRYRPILDAVERLAAPGPHDRWALMTGPYGTQNPDPCREGTQAVRLAERLDAAMERRDIADLGALFAEDAIVWLNIEPGETV